MTTFKQLQDRVKRRIIDLPDETLLEIPTFINEAIRDAQEMHNFRIMEKTIELTTTQGTHTLGQVSRFKEMRAKPWVRLSTGGQHVIDWAPSEEEMLVLYPKNDVTTSIGAPKFVLQTVLDADQTVTLEVWPFPDGLSGHPGDEYPVNVPYWEYLPPLVSDNDTNWFTNNAEQYVVWAASAKAFEFNEDEMRADRNLLKAQAELLKLKRIDKRSRIERSMVLTPRRDVHAFHIQRRM